MPEDIDSLIQALASKDPNARWAAAVSLGLLGDKRAMDALVVALSDTSVHVRVNVAEALGKIGEPAIGALCVALRDRSISVARNAAKALVRIGAPTIEPLTRTLRGDNPHARQLAAIALGQIGDSRAVIVLGNALTDGDETVRWNSLKALERIGNRDTLVRSILVNSHMTLETKKAALNVLRKAKYYPDGRMYSRRTSDARSYCEHMKDDADLRVRNAASEMLRYLAGDSLVRSSEPNEDDLLRPVPQKQRAEPDLTLPRSADAPEP